MLCFVVCSNVSFRQFLSDIIFSLVLPCLVSFFQFLPRYTEVRSIVFLQHNRFKLDGQGIESNKTQLSCGSSFIF